MKKFVILLFAIVALLSFSCNKYCNCKGYIDGTLDKNYKNRFVKESEFSCEDFSTDIDGRTYDVKCK